MILSRRGFLQSIGITATSIVVPKLWLPEPAKPIRSDCWLVIEGSLQGDKATYNFHGLKPGTYDTKIHFANISGASKYNLVINGKSYGDPRKLKSIIVN